MFSISLISLLVSCVMFEIQYTFSKYYKILKNDCSFVDKYSPSLKHIHIHVCTHTYTRKTLFPRFSSLKHHLFQEDPDLAPVLLFQLQRPFGFSLLHSFNILCSHLSQNYSFFIINISIHKTPGSLRLGILLFFQSQILMHYWTYHLIICV